MIVRKYVNGGRPHDGQTWPPDEGTISQAPPRNYFEDILYALANPLTALRSSGVGSDMHFPSKGEMQANQQRQGFDAMDFALGLNYVSSIAALADLAQEVDGVEDIAGLLPSIVTRGKIKPAVPALGLGAAAGVAKLAQPEAGMALGPGAQGSQPIQYNPQGPTPNQPLVQDLGASDLVIRHPRDQFVARGTNERIELIPHDASSAMFGMANVGAVERIAGQGRFRGRVVNVPDIKPQKERAKISAMTDQDMAKGTYGMLNAIPNGEVVYASSLSDNSLPIILQNWARGRVSSQVPTADELATNYTIGVTHGVLNDYGKPYINSDEVEAWHTEQAVAAEMNGFQPHVFQVDDQWGTYDVDNRYAPSNQMDFDTFVQIDPVAGRLYREGNIRAAERKYEHYQNQSENDWAVSPMSGTTDLADKMNLSEMDAQILADRFNAKIDAAERARSEQVDKHKARGRNIANDQGVMRATIQQVPGQPGRWEVEYPTPVVVKNFRKGGRMKLKKKRAPGMRVMH